MRGLCPENVGEVISVRRAIQREISDEPEKFMFGIISHAINMFCEVNLPTGSRSYMILTRLQFLPTF